MLKKCLFVLLLMLTFLPPLMADESPLKAELVADHEIAPLGSDFSLLLKIELQKDWHAYWKNPGDAGMPPEVEWQLPEGISLVRMEWPTPELFETDGIITFGYSDEATFLVTFHADQALKNKEATLKGTLAFVVCSHDTCLPVSSDLEITLPIGEGKQASQKNLEAFETARALLPKKIASGHLTKGDDQLTLDLAFDEMEGNEIALADVPLFFPESGTNTKKPNLQKTDNGIRVLLAKDQSKGVLVIGDKAYDIDFAKAENLPHTSGEEPLTFQVALLFAFLGGIILNLMPCVLPVVSLKVMSFMKMAEESRTTLIKHGLAFTLGVLVSFWVLAVAIIALQATGEAVGWGFQLQDPLFIAILTLIFVLLGLSLFGVFELGTKFANAAADASMQGEKKGYLGSFSSGVFATAVATPCTGPFMGSALGYALTQSPIVSLSIFTSLGVGMSLPYLLLGAFPALIRFFPKPGAWMESLKQFFGFLMLLTVIWLLWVFASQTSEKSLFGLLLALLAASFAAWVFGRFAAPFRSKNSRRIGKAVALITLIAALVIAYKASYASASAPSEKVAVEAGWESFSKERLNELRGKNVPVLVDFTAKWCLICQANHLVLSESDVDQALSEKGVIKVKADWTKRDPEITALLKEFGRSGVPLYVLFKEDGSHEILPQVLTKDSVISAIETSSKGQGSQKTDVR